MEMAAIVMFCFCFLYFLANLRIKIPNSSPVNKFSKISTIKWPFITCQVTFIMKCLLKRRVKVMEMVAILFCCQFEDQDPKITLGKQVFRNQHHQIAFNHLPNLF